MKIAILGAGAIGSLFGAFLSQEHEVVLIGRPLHIQMIRKHGLKIIGKTRMTVHLPAEESPSNLQESPDLLIVTVKSYDTASAIHDARPLLTNRTLVLSLQNGLHNIDTIAHSVDRNNILAGVTTHGAVFFKPGVIRHTGKGQTIVGELTHKKTQRTTHLATVFTRAGITTSVSTDIMKEIWIKAIINSSINPLTTLFHCKNGYLLQNPILEYMMAIICKESTFIAQAEGIQLSYPSMLEKTKQVICDTFSNYSSMVQSIQRGRKTEIDAINGTIVDKGKMHDIVTPMNSIIVTLIKSMERTL